VASVYERGYAPDRDAAHEMAEKKAKTAEKGADAIRKQFCPSCTTEIRVVQFAGAGPRGFFWMCEKPGCGYTRRTR